MAIDYSQLRNLTTREIIRALKRDGFDERKHKGGSSHRRFIHPDGRRVTVAVHGKAEPFLSAP